MLEAADEISKRGAAPTVVDLRFIKPLDIEGLLPVLASHKTIVTAEENALAGGVGEEIAALMKERGIAASCASRRSAGQVHRARDARAAVGGMRPEPSKIS